MIIRKEYAIVGLTLLGLFIFRLIFILQAGDIGWEPDEYLHFLETKTVFANFPSNLVIGLGVWAKPVFTYPYGFLVEVFNAQTLVFPRLVSGLIGLLAGVYVYKSVKLLTGKLWLAWLGMVMLGLSFLVFRSTTAVMTEPIFMLLVSMAVYYWLGRRFLWSSLLIGMMVVARLEGALFIPIWLYFLWREAIPTRQLLYNSLVLIMPAGIWNFLGFLTTGRLLFLLSNGYPTYTGEYGYGGVSHYTRGFVSHELLLTAGFLIATVVFLWKLKNKNATRNIQLVWVSFSAFFLIQNILWVGGLFGTAGLMRYFVGVMPLLVILAVWGLEGVVRMVDLPGRVKLAGLAGLALVQLVFLVLQLKPGTYYLGLYAYPYVEQELIVAGEWVQDNIELSVPVFADRPATIYYSGRDLNSGKVRLDPYLQQREAGVYVWSRSWGQLQGINLADFEEANATLLHSVGDFVYIYEI